MLLELHARPGNVLAQRPSPITHLLSQSGHPVGGAVDHPFEDSRVRLHNRGDWEQRGYPFTP